MAVHRHHSIVRPASLKTPPFVLHPPLAGSGPLAYTPSMDGPINSHDEPKATAVPSERRDRPSLLERLKTPLEVLVAVLTVFGLVCGGLTTTAGGAATVVAWVVSGTAPQPPVPPPNSVPAGADAIAERDQRVRELRDGSDAAWAVTQNIALEGGAPAEAALRAYIAQYENAEVVVAGQPDRIEIAHVAVARRWLEKLPTQNVQPLAPTPVPPPSTAPPALLPPVDQNALTAINDPAPEVKAATLANTSQKEAAPWWAPEDGPPWCTFFAPGESHSSHIVSGEPTIGMSPGSGCHSDTAENRAAVLAAFMPVAKRICDCRTSVGTHTGQGVYVRWTYDAWGKHKSYAIDRGSYLPEGDFPPIEKCIAEVLKKATLIPCPPDRRAGWDGSVYVSFYWNFQDDTRQP